MNVASLAEDGTGRWKKEGGHHRRFIHVPMAEARVGAFSEKGRF